MTQLERVERMLIEARDQGVCGTTFLRAHIPRYPARILELRREGWVIDRRPCEIETHRHESTQWVYEMVHA